MPLHDYCCNACDHVFEEVVKWDEYRVKCPNCNGAAFRIYINFNGIEKSTPSWMYDTLEVVDKEGGQHCQDFLKHPTKSSYKAWMKGEGLRPMEEGESTKVKKERDTTSLRKAVHEKFKRDNTIEVRT